VKVLQKLRHLAIISLIAGTLLLIIGFNPDTARLERIPEIALGSFLFLTSFAFLYHHISFPDHQLEPDTTIDHLPKERLTIHWDESGMWIDPRKYYPYAPLTPLKFKKETSVLKILDWALIGFILLLIPAFDLLLIEPLFWLLLVVLPCLAARLLITWYLKVKT